MLEVSICIGSCCHVKGSYNVIQTFQQMIEENNLYDRIDCKATFCMKRCENDGVAIKVGADNYNIKADNARSFFKENILPQLK